MRRLHVAALLALTGLALPTVTAFAQGRSGPGEPRTSDQANQASAPEGGAERQLKFTIALPPLPSAQCSATSTMQYEQRNTIARIKSTLQIADCTVASGAFTVAVRSKDEGGADKLLEFSETWQRTDAQDVPFTADYPIGENTELVSVRLRGLTCTCADSTKEDGGLAATPKPL